MVNEEQTVDKKNTFLKDLIPYVVIVIVVVLIRSFIITPVQVEGSSMYSTLNDGEILLLKKYDKKYERFDVVVFNYNDSRLIKRIIGLPGDNVEYLDNKLYINGSYIKEPFLKNNQQTADFKLEELGYKKIPNNYYFVLGDNRTNSTDSRVIGLVSSTYIKGKTDFAIFPFNQFGNFNK